MYEIFNKLFKLIKIEDESDVDEVYITYNFEYFRTHKTVGKTNFNYWIEIKDQYFSFEHCNYWFILIPTIKFHWSKTKYDEVKSNFYGQTYHQFTTKIEWLYYSISCDFNIWTTNKDRK